MLAVFSLTHAALAVDMSKEIDAATAKIISKVVDWRRHVHQYPELGNREVKTAKFVEDHLRKLGLEVRRAIAKDGVVGTHKGSKPGRVGGHVRKGTLENAIRHTQGTGLNGGKFNSIEEQNVWLAHWEERWAAPRLHGRKKRQVLEMYREEQPHLKPLPLEAFCPGEGNGHGRVQAAAACIQSVLP